jgi:hypothetical protein
MRRTAAVVAAVVLAFALFVLVRSASNERVPDEIARTPLPAGPPPGNANPDRRSDPSHDPIAEKIRASEDRPVTVADAQASLDGGEPPSGPRARLLDRANGAWASEARTSTTVHAITATGIRGAVQASLPELRECYEGWLAQNPKIAGKLKVGFTIAVDPNDPTRGKVAKVELEESDVGHVFMEGCVLAVFADLQFEAPPNDTIRVTYPLTFSSADDQPEDQTRR